VAVFLLAVISCLTRDDKLTRIVNRASFHLEKIFDDAKVDRSHGIGHAIWVHNKASDALDNCEFDLKEYEVISILLASLLHDATDRKNFPHLKNNENARHVLNQLYMEGLIKKEYIATIVQLVMEMINLVSVSVNKDIIPSRAKKYPWLLIPRYADRCAAIGKIGIVRCWQYTCSIGRPLFTEATPRVTTQEELDMVATPERYRDYKGNSDSFLCHFYDKLLHIGKVKTGIAFFDKEYAMRHQEMVDFVLAFGRTGMVNVRYIERLEASECGSPGGGGKHSKRR